MLDLQRPTHVSTRHGSATRTNRLGELAESLSIAMTFRVKPVFKCLLIGADKLPAKQRVRANLLEVVEIFRCQLSQLPQTEPGDSREVVMFDMQSRVERRQIDQAAIMRCCRLVVFPAVKM